MAKKKKQEECEAGAPLWMVTYGDLMSLLLTFFVLIVSFSSTQQAKFETAMGSLKEALGILDSAPTVPIHQEIMRAQPISDVFVVRGEYARAIKELEGLAKEMNIEMSFEVRQTTKGIAMRLSNDLLFRPGSVRLNEDGQKVVAKLASLIEYWPHRIRIEGYTDDTPIQSSQYPSNWELSFARSINVSENMQKSGKIDPNRFYLVGGGEYNPIAPNSLPDYRGLNRRVEIYVEEETERQSVFRRDNLFDNIENVPLVPPSIRIRY